VFKKHIQVRSEDARPNLSTNGQIRDDTSFTHSPNTSKLRDMVDSHVTNERPGTHSQTIARWSRASKQPLRRSSRRKAKTLKGRSHFHPRRPHCHPPPSHYLPTGPHPTLFGASSPMKNPLDPLRRGTAPVSTPPPTYPRFCYECWESPFPSHRIQQLSQAGQWCSVTVNHCQSTCTAPPPQNVQTWTLRTKLAPQNPWRRLLQHHPPPHRAGTPSLEHRRFVIHTPACELKWD